MGFQAVKLEIGRHPAPIFAQSGQQLLIAGLFLKLENSFPDYMNFDVIPFFKLKGIHNRGRQSYG
jgi:hypothetical protein